MVRISNKKCKNKMNIYRATFRINTICNKNTPFKKKTQSIIKPQITRFIHLNRKILRPHDFTVIKGPLFVPEFKKVYR